MSYSNNPVVDYDHYCAQQERAADAAVREGRAGECSACQTNTTYQRCTWCGRWICAECVRYDEHFIGCQLCWQLLEIHAHLGTTAVKQRWGDAYTWLHVEEALRVADEALDARRVA
jgi:hypothetical protein